MHCPGSYCGVIALVEKQISTALKNASICRMPSLYIGPMKKLINSTTKKPSNPKADKIVEKHAKMAEKEIKGKKY